MQPEINYLLTSFCVMRYSTWGNQD